MSDETISSNGAPVPPKINLPGAGAPGEGGGEPPRIKLKPTADKKSETSRIDIASAKPAPDTVPTLRPVDKEAIADFHKKSTIRIDEGTGARKSETQRIKSETRPVDAAAAAELVKKSTSRITMDEQVRKSESIRIELPPDESAKRRTAKIDTAEIKIAPAPAPAAAPAIPTAPPTVPPTIKSTPIPQRGPRTVQLRPVPPPTVSAAPAHPPAHPVAHPPATGAFAPAAPTSTEAKKSETARIDLPPDIGQESLASTARPKTIRIKRPDGTSARKALTIARPSDEARPAEAEIMAASVVEAPEAEEGPGAGFAIAALAAVLVTAVLIYVLLGQTFMPTIPFAGRI